MFRNNGKKRRVWARPVFVGDDRNIFTNIYPHPHFHSRTPTLVPQLDPPDYLKLTIDPKPTLSFWIYFNSTWCWCIWAATINKNKNFSKETIKFIIVNWKEKQMLLYCQLSLHSFHAFLFGVSQQDRIYHRIYLWLVLVLCIEK